MKVSYCIGIALLGCASAVSAQSGSERRVNLSVSNRLTYDTNALRALAPTSDEDDDNGGDFILSPAVNMDILLPVARQSVFLSGSLGYDFYMSNSRLNRENIGLAGGVNLAAGNRCTGLLSVDYTRGQMDDLTFIDGFDPNNVIESRGYNARVNCGEGQGLTYGGGYRHMDSENSSTRRAISDYRSDTFDVSLGYSRPALGTISLYGSYTNTTYPNRVFIVDSGTETGLLEDGVEVYSAGIRGQRQIGALLSGMVSAGFTTVKPKLPGVSDFSGPSYSANLTFTPGTRMQFSLTAERSVDQSNLLNISYAITDSISLDAQYAMSDSFSLVGGVGYVKRRLEQSPVEDDLFTANNDKNWRVSGGFRYSANRPWSLNGDISYSKRESDNNLFDYNSTRASLMVAYRF